MTISTAFGARASKFTSLYDVLEQLGNLLLYLRENDLINLVVKRPHLLRHQWHDDFFHLLQDDRAYAFPDSLPDDGIDFDLLLLLPIDLLLELVHLLSQVLILLRKLLEIINN